MGVDTIPHTPQWAATFNTTATTKHSSASPRIRAPALYPGRPVTIPTIANDMQATAIKANTAAMARTSGWSHAARARRGLS
jgi:hypothetical protein